MALLICTILLVTNYAVGAFGSFLDDSDNPHHQYGECNPDPKRPTYVNEASRPRDQILQGRKAISGFGKVACRRSRAKLFYLPASQQPLAAKVSVAAAALRPGSWSLRNGRLGHEIPSEDKRVPPYPGKTSVAGFPRPGISKLARSLRSEIGSLIAICTVGIQLTPADQLELVD